MASKTQRTATFPTALTTLWEQQGEAAARRGEPKVAPTSLRLTLQWAWLRGYEQAAEQDECMAEWQRRVAGR